MGRERSEVTMAIKLSQVGIAVKDMAASLRFYRLLDLPIPEGQEQEAHVAVAVGGVRLAWDPIEILTDVYGGWVDPAGQRIELAFDCETRDGVDETYARIVGQGHRGHRAPWDAVWGQRYAIVEDPDGNLVSLFAGES
jgi:catechol 2,3-dioxygenase-like lactoylglutathione lyase family enzyme